MKRYRRAKYQGLICDFKNPLLTAILSNPAGRTLEADEKAV
jgi:hypothetical protein